MIHELELLMAEAFNASCVKEVRRALETCGPDTDALRANIKSTSTGIEDSSTKARRGVEDMSLAELQRANDQLDVALAGSHSNEQNHSAGPSPPSPQNEQSPKRRFVTRRHRSFHWICDLCGTKNAVGEVSQRASKRVETTVDECELLCSGCTFRPKTV